MHNTSKRDFFVQMATGAGKSLVMSDLLAQLGTGKRACVIVPKLDLMEQMAQLLEKTLATRISRVGTNCPADMEADVFVSVRNSVWLLENLTFDLLLLDEAHHYEPIPDADDAGPKFNQSGVAFMLGVFCPSMLPNGSSSQPRLC